MNRQEKALEAMSTRLKSKNRALFVTGSVARGDATQNSDLDLLVITKSGHAFEEEIVDQVTVEIKKNTIKGFKDKMTHDPMNIYQWLDAKVVFDPDNLLPELQGLAQDIFDNYSPIHFPSKWLKSAKSKIESARSLENSLFLSFHVSNNLWKVVEGIYLINKTPLPPSSTAFKKIKTLKKLPENFDLLWEQTLTGDLEERVHTMLLFIEFLEKTHGM